MRVHTHPHPPNKTHHTPHHTDVHTLSICFRTVSSGELGSVLSSISFEVSLKLVIPFFLNVC